MQILHTIDMYINHYPSQIIAKAKCIVIWVVEFSREGFKIRKMFVQKIKIFKENCCILWIDIVASHQKLGIILENNSFSKLEVIKIYLLKKLLLNWYWKRIRKILFYKFLTQKIYFESQILALFDNSPLWQFTKWYNFLWGYLFLAKDFSNFESVPWKLDNPYYYFA